MNDDDYYRDSSEQNQARQRGAAADWARQEADLIAQQNNNARLDGQGPRDFDDVADG